ncbi:MAG: SUMF1/EgtB/PvdO family nonheme iron enzyme, partial [Myxococcales bacterium]|nr:SUMF1/EgtB/PvdO family nonheme iron enzyme [Myxococcales bacterium]
HLTGNAEEWVASSHPCAWGEGCDEAEHGVLRGGSYQSPVEQVRNTFRAIADPGSRSVDVGFRCAMDSPAPQGALSAFPYGQLPEPPVVEGLNNEVTRAIGFFDHQIVATDLSTGQRQIVYESPYQVASVASSDNEFGFSVYLPRGERQHYYWPAEFGEPALLALPTLLSGGDEEPWIERTQPLRETDGQLCIPVERVTRVLGSENVVGESSFRVEPTGRVVRSDEACAIDFGASLDACDEGASLTVDTTTGQVSSTNTDGATHVVFAVDPQT